MTLMTLRDWGIASFLEVLEVSRPPLPALVSRGQEWAGGEGRGCMLRGVSGHDRMEGVGEEGCERLVMGNE